MFLMGLISLAIAFAGFIGGFAAGYFFAIGVVRDLREDLEPLPPEEL